MLRKIASLILVGATMACGSSSEPEGQESTRLLGELGLDEVLETQLSPIDALVASRLGKSIDTLQFEVESLQYREFIKCMGTEGWSEDQIDYPKPVEPLPTSLPEFGWRTLLVERGVLSSPEPLGTRAEVAAELDGALATAQGRCEALAREMVPSPLRNATDLLDEAQQQLNGEVLSDRRYQESLRVYVECIDELGLNEDSVAAMEQHVMDRAAAIQMQYSQGLMTRDQALVALAEAADQEVRDLGEVDGCRSAQQRIERSVYLERQFVYLSGRQDELQAVVAAIEDEFERLNAG